MYARDELWRRIDKGRVLYRVARALLYGERLENGGERKSPLPDELSAFAGKWIGRRKLGTAALRT